MRKKLISNNEGAYIYLHGWIVGKFGRWWSFLAAWATLVLWSTVQVLHVIKLPIV